MNERGHQDYRCAKVDIKSILFIVLNSCFFQFVAIPAHSQSIDPNPLQQQNATALWFENWIGLSNATLNVVAPDGSMIQIFAASGTPVYQLGQNRAANAGPVLDGFYTYELTAAGDTQVKIVNPIDNGRGEAARDSHATPFAMNGSFTVSRGVIVPPEDLQEQDG